MSAASQTAVGVSHTHTRILDGALSAMSAQGIARLSLEDVARRAGLSRQTVYRYFPNKAALLAATVAREEAVFMANAMAAVAGRADLGETLEAAIAATLHTASGHALLQRLLTTERDSLVALLTGADAAVLRAGRTVFTAILAERLADAPPESLARTADVCARLLVSYILTPPEASPEHLARQLAGLLASGLAGTLPSPGSSRAGGCR